MELKKDVEAELDWVPDVNAAHIGVAVNDGVVSLTGHVPHYAEKYAAEKAAKRVYGVKAVADELDVKLPGAWERNDEDVATAFRDTARSGVVIVCQVVCMPEVKINTLRRTG